MRFFEWFNRHKAALITAIGYATAAVVTVTVFVYLTFPWSKLSDWIRIKVERAAALEISVRKSEVRFPFRLVWKGVTVSRVEHPVPVLWTAEEISVGWPIGAILRRHWDLDLVVQTLGGEARGRLTVRRAALGMKYRLEGSGKGLDLKKLAEGFGLPSNDVSGTILIRRIEHDWMNGDVLQGQGVLALEATGVGSKRWEIQFSRMNGSMSFKGGMGNLENFSAQGDALDLAGSGSLLLRPDVMDSLLNFNSRVTLRKPTGPLAFLSAMAPPDGHFDFALRGVLRRPTPYLNGTPFASVGIGGAGLPVGTGRAGEPPRLPTIGPRGPGQ
ncbi:MAG: type II secretion system protein GspN [Nitrospirae bacterium]|nr:type II secretion system protein GspN [Nitrospirota bacterium]